MERLSELPLNDDQPSTQEENDIIDKYFDSSSPKAGRFSRINWKLVGYIATLFLLLANPWIDMILCNIPYCNENKACLAIKFFLFIILVIVIMMFL